MIHYPMHSGDIEYDSESAWKSDGDISSSEEASPSPQKGYF